MDQPTDHEYLTLEETAEHFRMSLRQLHRLKLSGEIPLPISIGGRKLYSREQLAAIKRKLHIQAGFTA